MPTNWPLWRISLASVLPLSAVIYIQVFYYQNPLVWNTYALIWFLAGIVYVHGFEYAHHRWPMHTKLEVNIRGFGLLNMILNTTRMSHLWKHHRIFRRDNFQSRRKEDLEEVTSPWWFFPSAFLVHYLIFSLFLSPNSLNFFAVAVVSRYLLYEVLHFFTHKKDNKFDKFIFTVLVWIPYMGPKITACRLKQIVTHAAHHDDVQVNFSVTPPYLDPLMKTQA